MSFHVQKWSDISNDWSDIPSKKEAKKKRRRRKVGRKVKKERRKKGKKKGEVNKMRERGR